MDSGINGNWEVNYKTYLALFVMVTVVFIMTKFIDYLKKKEDKK